MNTPSPARLSRPGFLAAWFGTLALTLAVIAQTAGTAAAANAPIIGVEQGGSALTSGSSIVDFKSSPVGIAVSLTFTIRNTGTADLTGVGSTIVGTNKDDFTVTPPPTATVAAAGSTYFTVAFKPKASGLRAAALLIASNDSTNSLFNIGLTGTGLAPLIVVEEPLGTGLISGSSTVDFGSVKVSDTPNTLKFTIRNTGQEDLKVSAVTTGGANSEDFEVTTPTTATVATGGIATFTVAVAFNPKANGVRTAILQIASNDTTQSPFKITLTGTGRAPVIGVDGPDGTGLTSGTSTVDFGPSILGSSPQYTPSPLTFTITNTGPEDLTVSAVSTGGNSSQDFVVTQPTIKTVATGVSTTFTVNLKPSVIGKRTATLNITSNDLTQSPFTVFLTGNGMATQDPVIVVEEPAGHALTSDSGTVSFGSALVTGATPKTLTFTIRNAGINPLLVDSVTPDGTNMAEFVVSQFTDKTTVTAQPPTDSTTFTVTFNPPPINGTGTRFATIHVVSDDPATHSFDIHVTGVGTTSPTPVIEVEEPVGISLIPEVSMVDFGPSSVSSPVTMTFTIKNPGTASLTGVAATITRYGIASTEYKVTASPAPTVLPGDSTTCTVTFTPLIGGLLVGTLHITSNDQQHPVFDIYLKGLGLAVPLPVIAVEDASGNNLRSGHSVVDFGSELVVGGTPFSMTFTIKNTGTADLTGIVAFVTKGDAISPDFTVSASPHTTVAFGGGDSTTVTVDFNPSAAGTRTGTLRIKSNSPMHHSFNIYLTGNGMAEAAPLIEVGQQDGTTLVPGISKVNFGSSLIGSAVTQTLTISNTGTADLTVIDASSITTADGNNSEDFTLAASPDQTVAPRHSTTLIVAFNTKTGGLHSATLHITSKELPPFDIPVTGMGTTDGTAPAIAVEQPAGNCLTSDVSTVTFPTVRPHGMASMTFTVRNTLAARGLSSASNLRITNITLSGTNADEFQVFMIPGMSIEAGRHATFKVLFRPTSIENKKQASLSIYWNDPEIPSKSPFVVTLQGSSTETAPIVQAASVTAMDFTLPAVGDGGDDTGSGDMLAQFAQGITDVAPFFEIVTVDGQDWPAISFRRWKSPGSLIYVVEESTDMLNWTPVPTPWQLAGPIEDDGYGCERLTVLASEPVTAGRECYLRVRVQDGP